MNVFISLMPMELYEKQFPANKPFKKNSFLNKQGLIHMIVNAIKKENSR